MKKNWQISTTGINKAKRQLQMSCLFQALAFFVGDNHQQIRSDICNFLWKIRYTGFESLPLYVWMEPSCIETDRESSNVLEHKSQSKSVSESFTQFAKTQTKRSASEQNVSEQDETVLKYVNQMKMEHTWGGALEIRAASELYNVPITVSSIRSGDDPKFCSGITFYPSGSNSCGKQPKVGNVHISWNGNHFEPVVATNTNDVSMNINNI